MNKKQLYFIVALFAGLLLAAGAAFSAARAGTALLSLDPQTTTAGPGENVVMSVQLESGTAAAGVDLYLAYDPAILLVVDQITGTNGVQILPGTCPQPDFVIVNEANVVSGTLQYAVVDTGVDSGCTSGEVAEITFQCVGLVTSDVTFSPETELSDPEGISITLTTQNAAITCTDVTSTPAPTPTATEEPSTATPTPTGTLPPVFYLPLVQKSSGK